MTITQPAPARPALLDLSQQVAAPQVTIILPTYNEAGNIEKLIDRTLQALASHPGGAEILVVDDNSPDGTWQLAGQKAQANPQQVRLIHRTTERGLTSALNRGIKEARGEWVGWMDCDMSMPPEAWPRLAEALAQGADVAIGSRYVPGGSDEAHTLTGRLFSRAINVWAGLLLGWSIKDYTSGFVMARRQVFTGLTLRGDYGEYCIDLLYRARQAGYKIVELPYICVPRMAGESKTAQNAWGYLKRGVNYVKVLFSLRFGGKEFTESSR
ncbi:MAG TPA: polyprenol monophosphomannose synthase [Anaerolineae bacterium]|nr:polyprenol monophosphomannose synthase [Anaerolineae bacterium]